MTTTSINDTYTDSLNFLFAQLPMFSRIGAAAYKPGLETSLRLDDYFGNPHRKFKSIHIAGTNGKGSTSHMLAAMLQAEGYRVGLYTSPHLADFRERIRVNGEMMPREAVVDFVQRWRNCGYEGHPSFFELTMMMAFDWFARAEVDYAVIEVGMGGRLDSTNIITPLACVITNISPDHMQFLGDTPAKIAAEKAGIIKCGIPVTIGEAEGEVRDVFETKAKEVGAPIRFAQDNAPLLSAEEITDYTQGAGWMCTSTLLPGKAFRAALAGDYQRHNINTVLAAVEMLRNAGIAISDDSVVTGFAEVGTLTGLAGRWMKLSDAPLTIADTGHNIAGLTHNTSQLQRLMATRPTDATLRMVIGFVNDKDVSHIVHLLPRDAEYYITQASVPRAMPIAQLTEHLAAAGITGQTYPDVPTAYAAALKDASDTDIVFVGGSTFIVADLLASL